MQNTKNHLKICDLCQRKIVSKKNLIFHLNQRFVIENLRRHNLYTIMRSKILFNIDSKESFEINEKQNFRQNIFKICDLFQL